MGATIVTATADPPGIPAGSRLDPDARDRLAALAPRVATAVLAGERSVPVVEPLLPVLPAGLGRGSTVLVRGAAAVSTAALLAAGAVEAGAWVGAIGLDALSAEACREAGLPLERLVLVRGQGGGSGGGPGDRVGGGQRDEAPSWGDELGGQALAALVDGFDVVLAGPGVRLRSGTARRVQARLQQRGAVLVVVGDAGPFSCDLAVDTRTVWHGLGQGHGHLRSRQVAVTVEGRRVPRPRRTTLWFPCVAGQVRRFEEAAAPVAEPAAWRRTG